MIKNLEGGKKIEKRPKPGEFSRSAGEDSMKAGSEKREASEIAAKLNNIFSVDKSYELLQNAITRMDPRARDNLIRHSNIASAVHRPVRPGSRFASASELDEIDRGKF